MGDITPRYIHCGAITAMRSPSPDEIKFETLWLRKNILGKFLEDCVFAFRTNNGPDAIVKINFSSETGKGRRGTLVINQLLPPGVAAVTVPGIAWRWAALHDLWEQVNYQSDGADNGAKSVELMASEVIATVMSKDYTPGNKVEKHTEDRTKSIMTMSQIDSLREDIKSSRGGYVFEDLEDLIAASNRAVNKPSLSPGSSEGYSQYLEALKKDVLEQETKKSWTHSLKTLYLKIINWCKALFRK